MTKTITSIVALSVALTTAAWAQDDDHGFNLDNGNSVTLDNFDMLSGGSMNNTFSLQRKNTFGTMGHDGGMSRRFDMDMDNGNASFSTLLGTQGNWNVYDEEPAIEHKVAMSRHPMMIATGEATEIGDGEFADFVNYIYEVSANHNHLTEVYVVADANPALVTDFLLSGMDLSNYKEDMSAVETGSWTHPTTGSTHDAAIAHVHFNNSTQDGMDEFVHYLSLQVGSHTVLMTALGSENEEERVLTLFGDIAARHVFTQGGDVGSNAKGLLK